VGCRACQNACKDWNGNPAELDSSGVYDAPHDLSADTWTLIQLYEEGGATSFVKHQCMHCLEPACASVCPVQALEKTDEGPVTYDARRCIGCRYCMVACPFDVPRFEWDETIPVVAKCTFCSDRLAVGDGPRCVEKCPTGALVWGRRGDLLAKARESLAADPAKYVDRIYGEHDAGGTSVLYLSHVDFDNLGFPELGDEPVPEFSDKMGNVLLPGLIFGVPLALVGIRLAIGRKNEEG